MQKARLCVLSAIGAIALAISLLPPSAAPAQSIDLSLNVFYTVPANPNSGGVWVLAAKSSNFGISGVAAEVTHISNGPAVELAPTATVNGSDLAGFNIFQDAAHPTFHDLIFGQAPVDPLGAGEEQSAFYGVGQLANGAPNYSGKPSGSNSEGPLFTTLTSPQHIPWATGDVFGNPVWATAANLASGTFAAGVTPAFISGSTGNVFTSLGSSTSFGSVAAASITAIVRTNFVPSSADYNHNGIVDAADYVLWRATKGQNVTPFSGADGSGNGVIDQADYDLWRLHFGSASGAGSGGSLSTGAVPEPSAAIVLVIGAILVFGSQMRFRRVMSPALQLANSAMCAERVERQAMSHEVRVFCANRW